MIDISEMPEIFLAGGGSFTISFDGSKVTWVVANLNSAHKTSVSSDASSGSGRCSDSGARLAGSSTDRLDYAVEEESEISVYPNPAKDIFTVSLNFDVSMIEDLTLFDAHGKMVKVKPIWNSSSKGMEIDISRLNSGLYLIRINNGLEDKLFRIIKE